MLASWEVALILISLSLVVAFVIGAICRFSGVRSITDCFASDEEKAVLTKNDHHGNGYMVNSESDFRLDTSGKFVDYDTVKEDLKHIDVNAAQVIYEQHQQRIREKEKQLLEQHQQQEQQQQHQQQQQIVQQQNLQNQNENQFRKPQAPPRPTPPPPQNQQREYSRRGSGHGEYPRSGYDVIDCPRRGSDVVTMAQDEQSDSAKSSPVSFGSEVEEYKLQRAVSCDSLASDTSVMDLQPDISPIGQVEIGLEYDREVFELIVSVIQAKDLQQNEYTGPIDSYIRVILQPNDTKGHTKIQKKTSNPMYKERFLFNVEPHDMEKKTVAFQVFSCDKYARHKVIGETELRMSDLDLYQPLRIWLSLRDIDEKPADLGELMFSMSYLPTAERLTVVIVKARNLKWTEMKRSGDSMVKVFLIQNGRKLSKKRTSLKRDEANPVFNEAMIFSVPPNALQNVQLRFTVAEQITDGRTPSVGHVIVGATTAGTELSHWNQMMTSLRKPVSMWHNLIRHR